MRKFFKIFIKILWFLFVSVLIGYSVFLLNAKFILHEKLPMIGGVGHAVVLSGSMEPVISVNDLLIIKSQDSYEIDDIITYVDNENMLVTHRIIELNGTTVKVKGDANNAADPEFNYERIKGKVIAIIPKLGYVVVFFQNPLCVICVVVLAFILLERSYAKKEQDATNNLDSIKAEIEKIKSTAIDSNSSEQ